MITNIYKSYVPNVVHVIFFNGGIGQGQILTVSSTPHPFSATDYLAVLSQVFYNTDLELSLSIANSRIKNQRKYNNNITTPFILLVYVEQLFRIKTYKPHRIANLRLAVPNL